jgi:hypothetical protein
MVIKCILSGSLESIEYYARQLSQLASLPECITKRGPYVNKKEGAAHQIIVVYEFDKSKLSEAWSGITNQLNSLHGVSGSALSAHISESGKSVKSDELTL